MFQNPSAMYKKYILCRKLRILRSVMPAAEQVLLLSIPAAYALGKEH